MTETERLRASRWSTVVLLLLVGIFVVRLSSEGELVLPPQPAGAGSAVSDADRDADSVPMPRPAGTAARAAPPLPGSTATRIRIPSVHVDAPMTRVSLDPEGWIDAPPPGRPDLAGHFRGSVTPGEQGTSVIVGHVDTGRGPAVFYDLGRLARNSRVEVARADGTTAVFTVYGVKGFTKRGFPAASVYRLTGAPELRLITCGGAFSEKTGYQGNVVAFARLTETRKAA
ncbi:class F sortase [Streptomyces camponoticapitis]|uniref:Class F sortase n=1 Tax=Streptomyces camponoticapitis TaxID=1616125 RepID=A0ABQ2DZV5_9ACTN|nr:class F sortase [Streptomyces camponoticapitis]GGJ77953.1 class F sortase [Streptomyces camponoticapitis]